MRIADQSDIENIGRDAFDDETTSRGSSKDDLFWRTGSIVTRRSRKSGQSTPSFSSPLKKQTEFDEDLEVMLGRSKKYISIVKMVSRAFEIPISLCMKSGVKKWLNVTDFFLELPEWKIEKEVISLLDVANMFKKLVIKTLVQHSGKLLRNKMSTMLSNYRRLRLQLEKQPGMEPDVNDLEIDNSESLIAQAG